MREAGQKIANAFRVIVDKPEKEYGEKKFSKTGLIKKPFEAKRKLLSGILKFADAAIEKTEQLAADVRQYQTDKAGQEKEKRTKPETAIPSPYTAEFGCQYGADAFEMSISNNVGTVMDYKKRESNNLTSTKSR